MGVGKCPGLIIILVAMTIEGIQGSMLPEDFLPASDQTLLSSEEMEVIGSLKDHLKGSIQDYQRNLHVSYTRQAEEYNRQRVKRAYHTTTNLYWNLNAERLFPSNVTIIRHFYFAGNDYIILGYNRVAEGIYTDEAEIYRMDSVTGSPIFTGLTVETHGLTDIETILINGQMFLVFANGQFGPDDYEGLSRIMIFHPDGPSLVHSQYIYTYGVSALDGFLYEGDTYLAMANHRVNPYIRYKAPSKIFYFAGLHFDEVAVVDTYHASDIEACILGFDLYIAITQYVNNDDSYTPGTLLYRFEISPDVFSTNGGEMTFQMSQWQVIPSSGPKSLICFTYHDHNYMAIANHVEDVNGVDTFQTDSTIYWWATDEQYIEYQRIPTNGAMTVEYLDMEKEPKLLVFGDRSGLHFYQPNENAFFEPSDTILFKTPNVNITRLNTEFFAIDEVDYLAAPGGTFSTTEGASDVWNLFSFDHVNETTTAQLNETIEVYLPACAANLTRVTQEEIVNADTVIETLGQGVSKSKGQQVINSNIIITGHVTIPRLQTTIIEIQEGQEFDIETALLNLYRNNTRLINTLTALAANFVTKSTAQTIIGPVTMTSAVTTVTGTTTADSFTTTDGLVNEFNITYIDSIALRNTGDQTMLGPVDFTDDLTIGTYLNVSGLVGGISIPDDVMTITGTQMVDGSKTFTTDVTFNDDVTVSVNVNGLDLSSDVVLTTATSTVYGAKSFSQGITLGDTMAFAAGITVDTVDVSEFAYQVLRVSTGGTVTGNVTFESPVAMSGGVDLLTNVVNGINIMEVYNDTVFVDANQTITANKYFLGNLRSLLETIISGTVNGVDLSEQIFRLTTNQTITANMTITPMGIHALRDVTIGSTVNTIDLSEEVVLVNVSQTITGEVVFSQDIEIAGDIIVGPNVLINGVDISEYAATAVLINEDLQAISGEKSFTKTVTVSGTLEVADFINGVDIEELYDDILSITRPQTFQVEVDVESTVQITGDAYLNSTLDGILIPDDLVALASQTDINGEKTFSSLVYIQGDLIMGDNDLNGEDLSAFSTNILKDTSDQTVSASDITFNNPVSIAGDLTVVGTVNGYTIPDDFVFLNGDQIITGVKTFNEVSLFAVGIDTPDLQVDGTVDTVDIDALYGAAVLDGSTCDIAGAKTFATFEVAGPTTVSGTIDGVDLLLFNSTAVFLALDHTIAGDKTFTSAVQFDEDVTVSLVEGLDFSNESAQVIYRDTAGDVHGAKTFASGLTVTTDMDVEGLINGVNITLLDELYLSKQYQQTLSGAKTFSSDITIANLTIASGELLDGIDPDDFLLLAGDETINEAVSFGQDVDITGSVTVGGLINTVDIVELYNTTVWLVGMEQEVEGTKTFPSITVYNNITIDPGLVDEVDVSDLASRVLDYTRDNEIDIDTVITGQTTVTGDLVTEGDIGGVNLGFLLDDAIVLDEDFNIAQTWIFASTADVTMNSLSFEDDLTLSVQLGVTTLSDFFDTAILASTDQNISHSIVFDQDIDVQCLDISGLTDGIDLSENAVLKDTTQTISGCTRFGSGFRVNADISVAGTVDDIDLDTLISERVTYSTNQTITGTWGFSNLEADGSVTIDGTLNLIDVGDDLVTTYMNEIITGVKDFQADMVVVDDLITAVINDVDIVELANKVVLTEGSFNINGQKSFSSPLTMESNTDVTGLVNCVDVGMLESLLYTKTDTFNQSVAGLGDAMQSQCAAAASMQSSLGEHPLLLTHWEDVQDIDNPAAGTFHSVALEGGNTLLALAETFHSAVDRCVGTLLYLCPADWPGCIPVLDQPLPASVNAHLYGYRGDAFIVLLPSQQSGLCAEHYDGRIDQTTVLKLRDSSYNETLTTPHASASTMFEIGQRLFLVVANYKDADTSNTDVNSTIYELNNSTGSFDLFQEIPTHGASDVTHLLWNGFTWLCFANNVLDQKSPIYVYDAFTDQFVVQVREGTNHATSVKMFVVENVPFAVIASESLIGDQREVEFHREITILAYHSINERWHQMESIAGYGILDTAAFAVDDFVYLVATSLEAGVMSIYEWHHAGLFEMFQTIPFTNQYHVHAFVHQHEVLMALSRPAFTSAEIFSWKSKLMKAVIRGKTSDTILKAW